MIHISLFNGIGGFQLAAQWMGWENTVSVEINKFCNSVTKKHFPNCKQHDNIYTFSGIQYRGRCDIITGGWPCPKYSQAGKQEGNEPLKQQLIRVTKEVRPKWFVFENVPGLIAPKLSIEHSELINEMELCGYETRTFSISADKVGAYQVRERIWIVGCDKVEHNTHTETGELGKIFNEVKKEGAQSSIVISRNTFRLHWYEYLSRVHRIFNGVSRKLDKHRNESLGNAIVPQVAYQIFKTIEQSNLK